MGVRVIGLAVVLISACDGGSRPGVLGDAALDAPSPDAIVDTCAMPKPAPLCSTTCGNGQIDACFEWYQKNGYCYAQPRTEMCDGEATPTCDQRGFFGGTKPCNAGCDIDDRLCEACAPGGPNNLGCGAFGNFRLPLVAVSGALVGVSERYQNAGAGSRTWIFDGLTKLAATMSPLPRARDIVGVPGGWLIATSGSTLQTLDANGELGTTTHPIDTDEPAMAFGPGQRVLVGWSEYVQPAWQAYFELVDTSGQIVVPKTLVFGGSGTPPGVDANATSFFFGVGGRLAKIASDGTRTVTTGFPVGVDAYVTVDGTSGGWYANETSARRFDADGAPVGGIVSVGDFQDILADGTDLLVLRYAGARLVLDRIDASGATVASIVVGAGVDQARLARAAGSLYVLWTWHELRIAKVSI